MRKPVLNKQQGQAQSEYLPLIAMIAIASLAILGLFGDTLQQQFSHVAMEIAGKQATNSQVSPASTSHPPSTQTPTTQPSTTHTEPDKNGAGVSIFDNTNENEVVEVKCESHWKEDKYQSKECNGRWFCGLRDFPDNIKAAAHVIYDFFEGVASGIGDQLNGLWALLKDPTVLYEIAKAFIDNPKGVIEEIVKGLGADVEKVLKCGPKDVGKVIGQYASPVMALKVITKVAKITKSKKLEDFAAKIDCNIKYASFAAGTLVWTDKGKVAINDIQIGQSVYSRNKTSHQDQLQKVTKTFGRTATGYYLLTTEFETLKVTEEHPLWLQGKGWTKVSEVTANDVIASLDGDVLILDNKKIETPLQVYNFSVANTPSYFVGESKLWAHNAAKPPCKNGAEKVKDILDELPGKTGKTGPIKEVLDENALNDLFDSLSKDGKTIDSGTYPGVIKELPDSTIIRRRPSSKSGGATLDITMPNGKIYKVHIK